MDVWRAQTGSEHTRMVLTWKKGGLNGLSLNAVNSNLSISFSSFVPNCGLVTLCRRCRSRAFWRQADHPAALAYIASNCQLKSDLAEKIAQNCSKLLKIAQNCSKLLKTVEKNCSKLLKIAQNCSKST